MEVSKPSYLQVLHPPRDREPLALDFFPSAVTEDIEAQILLQFSRITGVADIKRSRLNFSQDDEKGFEMQNELKLQKI
jgi:hypothetical protein